VAGCETAVTNNWARGADADIPLQRRIDVCGEDDHESELKVCDRRKWEHH